MDASAASAPLSTLAYRVIRDQLALLRQHEPGARTGDDPEDLHDMRVATRRLRAALRTFDGVLPAEGKRLYEELRWLGGGLAAVRDLDVQIERLHALATDGSTDDREALDALRGALERDEASARAELNELLDSERYRSMLSLGADLLTRPVADQTDVTVGGGAWALVEPPFRRFRKRARRLSLESPAAEFHEVRKRARLLRYTVEFVSDAFPRPASRFVRRLVALQDVLGKHQDAEVAIGQLRALVERSELSPGALFALGQLAQRHAQEAANLRAQFSRVFDRVEGKAWRRLRRELRRADGSSQRDPGDGEISS
jgi:CHAD domain-containing protein